MTDRSEQPRGLGEPVAGMPRMTPPEPRIGPTAGYVLPPPPPEPPRFSRRPWFMLAGLGLAVVAALVTGLVLIGGEASAPPSASDGRIGEACVPPSAPVEVDPLVAEDFYRHDPWTYSGDASESAERLGVWNHTDCCDIGLSSSQGALNDLGCGYGIEAAYRSQDGHTGIAQLILAFGSDIAAFEAEAIDFMSYRMAPDSGIYETDMEIYAYSQAIGQYLVVTIGAIDSTDPAVVDRGKRTLGAFHEDFTTALLLG